MLPAPKPFASLSPGLLARKGQARPAMRRQVTLAEAGDALGWNDMGEPAPLPPLLAEREGLEAAVEQAVAPEQLRPVLRAAGRRVAFTLRLDPDRHLRLRLAAATRRTSSQRLVTDALDAFLDTASEVEALSAAAPEPTTATSTERSGI